MLGVDLVQYATKQNIWRNDIYPYHLKKLNDYRFEFFCRCTGDNEFSSNVEYGL